jgi:hypothetical protein
MGRTINVALANDGRSFLVKSPYSKDFVDEFKGAIPANERTWDGERKVWGVSRQMYTLTCELIRKHFGNDCDFRLSSNAEAALTDLMVDELAEPTLEDYVYLGLRPEASPLVIHAAYDICELYTTVRAYLATYGGQSEDPFMAALPAWMRRKVAKADTDYVNIDDISPLAGDPEMGPAASIETIRAAYLRICKHRSIDPITPTATFEQLAGTEEGDEAVKAKRVEVLSRALMDSMAAKPKKR